MSGHRPWGEIRKSGDEGREERVTGYRNQLDKEMMSIPESDKITARPVWARHQRRHYLSSTLGPPTEEEMHDAILVLSDPDLQADAPDLHLEAFSILVEEH